MRKRSYGAKKRNQNIQSEEKKKTNEFNVGMQDCSEREKQNKELIVLKGNKSALSARSYPAMPQT